MDELERLEMERLRAIAARHEFLLEFNAALRPIAKAEEIERVAAELLGRRLGAARVHYAEMSSDGGWGSVRGEYCGAGAGVARCYRLDDYGVAILAKLRAGQTVAISSVADEPRLTPSERTVAARLGIGAYALAPLVKDARPVALLAVHHAAPHVWTGEELVLIEETAQRTWPAVVRALSEANLTASEARLQLALDAADAGVWEAAPEIGEFVGSDRARALLGLPPGSAVTPEMALAAIHREDRPKVEEVLRQALRDGFPFRIELRVAPRNETARWLLASGEMIEGRAGRRLAGLLQDITERKRTESALRESEARFASFMQHLPGLAWIKDSQGRYLFANDAALKAFQQSREQLYGRTDFEVFDPATAQQFIANDRMAKESESGFVTVETLMQPDGVMHHSLVSKFPMKGPDGGSGGVAIDITERKQAEEKLEQEALLIELSFDPIFMWDWDSGIVRWNRGCEQLYGFSRSEALGRESHGLLRTRRPIPDEEFKTRLLADHAWAGELRHSSKDGREIIVESRHQLITVGGRKLVLESNRDITERKQAERALMDANKRKDEFLALLAHELRNPLAPIRNGLHVLRGRGGGENATIRRMQDIMERQVDHLVRLVDDLLDISRISTGKIQIRKKYIDLVEIVSNAVEVKQEALSTHKLQLRANIYGQRLWIEADPTRINQVVTNLLSNAIKFTEPGGTIEITAVARNGEAILSIADTGVGIPSDMLGRIFDLFSQVKRTCGHGEGGLGIGLTLARDLVRLHGGDIEAFSEGVNKGSKFVVRLPLSQRIAEEAPGSRRSSGPAAPSRRVLVIDDNKDVADSFAIMLEALGAQVSRAYDGAQGISNLRSFRPDFVFLDVGMPGMDGYETARRIRALPEGENVALIALTGWGDELTRDRARASGFDLRLIKPADATEIERLLASSVVG